METYLYSKCLILSSEQRLISFANEVCLIRTRAFPIDDVSERDVLETDLLTHTVVIGNVDTCGDSGSAIAHDVDAGKVGLEEYRLWIRNHDSIR